MESCFNNYRFWRKPILTLLILVLIIPLFSIQSLAAPTDTIVVKLGDPWMLVNGVKKEIDPGRNTVPAKVDGRILVPVRAIVEEMGGSIGWEPNEKRIDIELGTIKIQLWIDKKDAIINGERVIMDVPPMTISSRTMIPVRFVAENLGADVKWNDSTKEATISFGKESSSSGPYDWDYVVINDIEIPKSDYIAIEKNDEVNIFVSLDKLQYAAKFPSLYVFMNPYPDVNVVNDNISFSWELENEIVLQIDMKKGSTEIVFDGEIIDLGVAPFDKDGKLFVPANIFIILFQMKPILDEELNALYLQYNDDFPSGLLVGTWSDVHTDLFTAYKDVISGAVGLSSFANSYKYKDDGTYQRIAISVGGFQDTFVDQSGKYKIMGNTIMHYDIIETVYKGNPFQLVYKDRKFNKPSYSMINSYRPESDEIEIDGFWLDLQK
ncbi:copper amine oxidase N-terminal domain-containing protein [Tissierella sp.]|uniref:copper amine oxidase N-terminal domain-containing protein n=1 Tax=Tissierella sp. TaxID=41274 RepID=UPI0028679A1C|nr:copper amine oxidase N-terminal domain-containing protein [Tissierella sp.]MDR7855110.1 copper amine oxidase N-terminal domain-containing protein [Tissierella sp.]